MLRTPENAEPHFLSTKIIEELFMPCKTAKSPTSCHNRTKIDRAGRPMSFFTGQREHCFKPCWQKQPVECVYNLQWGRQKRKMSQALSRDVLGFSGALKKIRVARRFLIVSHQES